jgi:hypothetical protein
MLRAAPGCRRISPARSSVSTIWWTEGGVTRKWRCRSASDGDRKRHLRTVHGLTPEEYRARWGLASDYPMVAPNYSEKRSAFAHSIGLGRLRSEPAPEPPKPLEPPPDSTSAAKAAPRRRKRGTPAS